MPAGAAVMHKFTFFVLEGLFESEIVADSFLKGAVDDAFEGGNTVVSVVLVKALEENDNVSLLMESFDEALYLKE